MLSIETIICKSRKSHGKLTQMSEFLKLVPPKEALARLLSHLTIIPKSEEIDTIQALGRVTHTTMHAPHPLPSFPRSTVDGFAVRAADTHGASESLPAYLQISGEVMMGFQPERSIAPTECMVIHTGGMLPDGADAVVMIEHTQQTQVSQIEILRAVGVGENVIRIGEDVKSGEEVIPAGTRLRPAEIGGLMALGFTRVLAALKPKVGILSSGDEIVPPDGSLSPGQVRDINTYSLSAMVTQYGGEPIRYGIIPDEPMAFQKVAKLALEECDVVLFTAGSSVSVRDLTSQTIDSLGKPGILVHGVNIRPGKPTILAVCEEKAVIGLPGNPVSALVIAGIFVKPVIEALLGLQNYHPTPSIRAQLTVNVASQAGREDWIGVRVVPGTEYKLADPIFGKSNLIFTLSRADGLVCIPSDANGISAGEMVEVHLF